MVQGTISSAESKGQLSQTGAEGEIRMKTLRMKKEECQGKRSECLSKACHHDAVKSGKNRGARGMPNEYRKYRVTKEEQQESRQDRRT